MRVQELKDKVESVHEELKKRKGAPRVQLASESGPIGIGLIDAVVSVLETLEKRIDELERGIVNA